jgi:hypothetical protein
MLTHRFGCPAGILPTVNGSFGYSKKICKSGQMPAQLPREYPGVLPDARGGIFFPKEKTKRAGRNALPYLTPTAAQDGHGTHGPALGLVDTIGLGGPKKMAKYPEVLGQGGGENPVNGPC